MALFNSPTMKMTRRIMALSAVFLALLGSCSEAVDFDQADDLIAEPEVEASILYIEVPERIINLTTGASFFFQDFNFDAFSDDLFAERVIEGTVTYEVENTTSKELVVTVQFLDTGGSVLDTETFMVAPAPTSILQTDIIYGPSGRSIDIIKNTSSIRVSAENLGDTTSVSTLPDPLVTLKSKGKFTLSLI